MDTPGKSSKNKTPLHKLSSPYDRRKSSSGCYAPFKAPTPGKAKPTTKQNSKVVLAKELLSLKQTEEELDKEISELSSDYSEEELQVHIDLLHEYNEIKDVGQLLLGRLAQIEGTTTKELYQRFDLDIED